MTYFIFLVRDPDSSKKHGSKETWYFICCFGIRTAILYQNFYQSTLYQLSKIYIYQCSTKSCTFLDEDFKKPLLDNDTEVLSDMKQS